MVEGLHLLPRHRKEIVALLHKHIPGVEVWAYGSRVNGRSHDGSDLDLVLRGPQLAEIDASQLAEITEVLREATVPFLIEARDWARLPKSFHREIEREHVVLVAGSGEAVREEFGIGGERIYCRLEDCMAAIIDYRGKTPRKTSSGIPLITAKVVKGGRIKTPTEFIAIEDYDFWMRRGIPRLGDVLITTEAPLGEVAQLCQQRVALAQRLILLRGKSEVLDNRFLKFLMQSAPVQHQLHARATGTTVLGIKQKELRQIGLALPPLPEQRAIAHILGTLDDKIELNRRMNETLEAMARALFKSWFVDFDPVRAKMAGRNTGLPQDLADLFPARLVESELGEIPEGWEVKVLAECTDLTMGQSQPRNLSTSACHATIAGSCQHLTSARPSRATRRWLPISFEAKCCSTKLQIQKLPRPSMVALASVSEHRVGKYHHGLGPLLHWAWRCTPKTTNWARGPLFAL